jgi:hypothetical protein
MMSILLLVAGLSRDGAYSQAYEGTRAEGGGARLQIPRVEEPRAGSQGWLRQDLHLTAALLTSYQIGPGQHLLLCQGRFSMSAGERHYASERALVWIAAGPTGAEGLTATTYEVQVYLGDGVSEQQAQGKEAAGWTQVVLEQGKTVVVKGRVDGEIFVTADKRQTEDPGAPALYRQAVAAFQKAGLSAPSVPESLRAAALAQTAPTATKKPAVGYTVSLAPLTQVAPKIEWQKAETGEEIATIIGRIYLTWWQQTGDNPDQSQLYELEADSVVLWRVAEATPPEGGLPVTQQGGVTQIYVSGDVLLRQGQRTIRADEVYYDLLNERALATNVVMKTFDTTRNVPIYLRARQFQQVAENEFEADDIVLTTSEFWTPQISLQAERVHVVDNVNEAKPEGALPKSSLDVQLKNVKFKYHSATLLDLPGVRSNRERPDIPIRSIRVGSSRAFGPSIETCWFLDRVLGLRQPEGTDSTAELDYYGKRGLGGGVEINYERENYFGALLGYAINDKGEDRLSRTREDVDVPEDMRGRFRLRHRQFLPYNWQLTAEVSYLSDKNFLEQYYRTEFNVDKEEETLLYLKRIQDNWALSFLGKTRINDFMNQVEELPTAEYHLTGESLFDDRFTFYSDNQVSRYRYRFSSENPIREPDEFFTFVGTRQELDLPLAVGRSKIVPFVAGTFGYEDGSGFHVTLDESPAERKDAIGIGEGGVRMSVAPFWCVYPDVESRLWDLHQLRHVIEPSLEAVAYAASDVVAEQRDTLDLEILQRWQTKRGLVGHRRTVDWLTLDTDFVWVSDSSGVIPAPNRFIWNAPFIPLSNPIGTRIPPQERETTGLFGPRQNYASTAAVLTLTDTTALLSDIYFNMQSGAVEQFDIGFSRLCWPNLSYYVGSRYLRNVRNGLGEKGSNILTFAATYVLDPRYTAVFAQQYDFDYGANILTEIALIRKYHRMNLALTFSVDESLDEKTVVLSLWPEGISELAIGLTRYMGLGASDVYY